MVREIKDSRVHFLWAGVAAISAHKLIILGDNSYCTKVIYLWDAFLAVSPEWE